MMITANQYNLLIGAVVIVLSMAFLSCSKNPTEPVDSRPLISAGEYQDINLTLKNYDLVHVTHAAGLDLRSPSVVRVEVGVKNDGVFVAAVSSVSTYDANAEAYVIHFDFTVQMDSSKITAPLTIRYITEDSASHDVDTTVALYKYPYPSAQVFADSTILENGRSPIQGLSLAGSTMFYHPLDEGLFAIDLSSRVSSLRWNGYYNGSHIAADSSFVFCDVFHQTISRFDLTTNTALGSTPNLGTISSISGMAVQFHTLYVLVYGQTGTSICSYSLQGVHVDSIAYPSNDSYFMAMSDSVVYCKDETSIDGVYQISRFDLRTKSFLANLMPPAKEVEGIAISDGRFYYYDMSKNFIGVVPLVDLKSVGTTP